MLSMNSTVRRLVKKFKVGDVVRYLNSADPNHLYSLVLGKENGKMRGAYMSTFNSTQYAMDLTLYELYTDIFREDESEQRSEAT